MWPLGTIISALNHEIIELQGSPLLDVNVSTKEVLPKSLLDLMLQAVGITSTVGELGLQSHSWPL